MTKVLAIAIAGALALYASTPTLSAPAETRAATDARTAGLQRTAAEAEARINQSAEARAALHAATPEAARAVLLRNGFTAKQLEGVPIKIEKAAAGGGATPSAARIKSITIKVSCCPPEIVITIRF